MQAPVFCFGDFCLLRKRSVELSEPTVSWGREILLVWKRAWKVIINSNYTIIMCVAAVVTEVAATV